jgi:Bardet-Biedl syndrome 2 protein
MHQTFDLKVLLWMSNNFLLEEDLESETSIEFGFIALRTNKALIIKMETNGQVIIATDDIELAGSLIQSLASYLNINDLQVNCDFPDEIDSLKEILVKVNLSFKLKKFFVCALYHAFDFLIKDRRV